RKLAVQPVRRHSLIVVAVGCGFVAPTLPAYNAGMAHQAACLVAAHRVTTSLQLDGHLARAYSAAFAAMNGFHRFNAQGLPRLASVSTLAPVIVTAAGYTQYSGHRDNAVIRLLRVHEVIPHFGSLAKKAVAFF